MRGFAISTATWLVLLPALAICADSVSSVSTPNNNDVITAAQIENIDPKTASCDDADPKAKAECATSATAAKALAPSLQGYGFTTPGEKAALISLILFESVSFKYNRNKSPGNPGQGTRNMQSARYNALYADDLVKLNVLKKEDVDAAKAKQDEGKAVLDLLLPADSNDMDFGSAGWFLKTQCTQDIRTGLQNGLVQGWEDYITKCVQTTVTEERRKVWLAAMNVFSSSAPSSASPTAAASSAPAASPTPIAPSSSSTLTPITSATSLTTVVATKTGDTAVVSSATGSVVNSAGSPTTLITMTSAAASVSASASAAPAPQAPPAGDSGTTNTCSGEGALVCNGGSQFGLCQGGKINVWQAVAAGTKCENNKITFA